MIRHPRAQLSIVIMIGLLTGGLLLADGPVGAAPGDPTASTEIKLASVGNDGAAADSESGQAALAANGRSVAFSSAATLAVGAGVDQTSIEGPSGNRVYVRDRIAGTTSVLSDGGSDDATAPSISADGRLVAYAADEFGSEQSQIVVVDRQATGAGAFDTPDNLKPAQVTDNAQDPHFQRVSDCFFFSGNDRCGPQLSADGRTLVYPAELSATTRELTASSVPQNSGVDVNGNMFELSPSEEGALDFSGTVTYFNNDNRPIEFRGPPTMSAPFVLGALRCGGTTVTSFGTINPGGSCSATVSLDGSTFCPGDNATVLAGDLNTDATIPDGQTQLQITATCPEIEVIESLHSHPLTTTMSAVADCPAVPTGLSIRPTPQPVTNNAGTPLVDFGPTELGLPTLESMQVTGVGTLTFSAADCSLRLVDPVAVGAASAPTDGPTPCQNGQQLGVDDGETATTCTAYFFVDPQGVDTRAALLTTGDPFNPTATYLTENGVQNVVVKRTGPDFAGSATEIVSRADNGAILPRADEPILSADGRYLAFRTVAGPNGGTRIWRRNINPGGTTVPVLTELVSCQPGDGDCQAAPDVEWPAISGDGSRVAFDTVGSEGEQGQVLLRDVGTEATTAISPGSEPAITQDGATVAFVASLDEAPTNLYLADLDPAGTVITPTIPAHTTDFSVNRPSLDQHGRLVAFQTSGQLDPAAPVDTDSVYTYERFGQLTFDPSPVDYGDLDLGSPPQTRTVTVTNSGPGPSTVTAATSDAPFQLVANTCQDLLLRHGQSCTLTVQFDPSAVGSATGTLTATTADDGEAPVPANTTLTANVPTPITPTTPVPPTGPTTTVPTPPGTVTAVLTVAPTVAYGGEVVQANGVGFPANTALTLIWDHGLGQTSVRSDASGRFTAPMVIFRNDELGTRNLEAVTLTGTLATTPVLVERRPMEPPFHELGG
jgi:hypothetical protein